MVESEHDFTILWQYIYIYGISVKGTWIGVPGFHFRHWGLCVMSFVSEFLKRDAKFQWVPTHSAWVS